MSTLESALKSGRLIFQWREVRPWLRLAPGNTMPTLQDDLQIELPLAIVAPRFIEQRTQAKPKPRFSVGDDIPDVFEQKTPPASQPAPTGTMAPPLGATAVALDLAPALGASSATGDTAFLTRTGGKTLLEFGEIFGQPEKKNWSLAEIAQKTLSLRGVTGAIIASGDGLLVAGTWPNGVKGDAVSAFLPQLYGRILQYTKELKLGEPGHVTLMIENVPLQIFKAGTSFFTVLGRAGENLPKAQLNAIATRLSTNFSVK
jgi:predicted regulator of Ras-like GTPase activity (Roadblock/LC7/MglB family)